MSDQQNPVQPPAVSNSASAPLAPAMPGSQPASPASAAPVVPADTTNPAVSYVDDYQPPKDENVPLSQSPAVKLTSEPQAVAPPASAAMPAPASNQGSAIPVSQTLEDQNIFFLLGVDDGTDEEKESFLDELQQVIWEDFLENDVQLLITEEEKQGLQQIQVKTGVSEEDKQEEMVVYLEKLIPDLEEIMLEKALELKEDMVKERIAGMREYYADRPEELKKVDEAAALIKADKWRDAATALNSLRA